MHIRYFCRHCGTEIGQISGTAFYSHRLGFHALTPVERKEMLSYSAEGSLHVSISCEDCQEALEQNPDFHELNPFIQ